MTVDTNAWLATLKVGDTVILQPGYLSGRDDCLVRVERITATQIAVQDPTTSRGYLNRFRRSDGSAVASRDAYDRRYRIVEPTPERVAAIRRATVIKELRETDWAVYPDDVLEAVAKLVEIDLPNAPAARGRDG